MQMSNIGTPNTDEIWKSPPPDYSEVFSNDNEVKKSPRKSIELVVCICMGGPEGWKGVPETSSLENHKCYRFP